MESFIRTVGNIISFFRGSVGWMKSMYASNVGKALTLNVVIYIVLNAIAYATFTCNIDIMINSLISNVGVFYQTSHVGFSNTYLMKLLCILIDALPNVAWYTWLLEVISFIAISILGIIILNNHSGKSHVVALIVFDIFVGYECYMFPSYIKSSIILTFAALMFIYYTYVYRYGSIKLYIIGGLLMLLASMLSMTGFWLALIAGILVMCVQLIVKAEYNRNIWKLVVVVFCGIIAAVLMRYIDNKAYTDKDIDESLILEYRDDIEKLLVFSYPTADDNYLEELELDSIQYSHLQDYDEFLVVDSSSKLMSKIHVIADKKMEFNGENVLKYFRTVPISQIKVGFLYLLVIVAFLMMNSRTKRRKVYVVLSIIIALAAGFIAFMNNAWDSRTVQLLIYLPIVYLMLVNMKRIDGISCRDFVIGLVVLGVVLYGNFSEQIVTKVNESDKMQENFQDYLIGAPTLALDMNAVLRGYSAYAAYPNELLYNMNCVIVNGYYCIYPVMEDYGFAAHKSEMIMWNESTLFDSSGFLIIQ